jgi:hypothetical protein
VSTGHAHLQVDGLGFVEDGLKMIGGPYRVLAIPTPGLRPDTHALEELQMLGAHLAAMSTLEYEIAGTDGNWPSMRELAKGLEWANLLVIPDGSYLQLRAQIQFCSKQLRAAILTGSVFVTFGAGAGLLADQFWASDQPHSEGGGNSMQCRPETGFRFIPGLICVSANESRRPSSVSPGTQLKQYMKFQPPGSSALVLDSRAAMALDEGQITALSSDRRYGMRRLLVKPEPNPLDEGRIYSVALRQGDPPVALARLLGMAS